jgi:hypothetical protein
MKLEMSEETALYLLVNLVGILGLILFWAIYPLSVTGAHTFMDKGVGWGYVAGLLWDAGQVIYATIWVILVMTDGYWLWKNHLQGYKIFIDIGKEEEEKERNSEQLIDSL